MRLKFFFCLVDYLQSIAIENYKKIILAWYCNLDYKIKEFFFCLVDYLQSIAVENYK